MKKSLLALAVLTAVAGTASAESSVTLYGTIDVGGVLDSGAVNNAGKSARISSGVARASRLGFKGVEELGNGLKASFQLETGFCSDSNAPASATQSVNFCSGGNNFMGRQAHVDLSGAFGAVSAGRQFTPAYLVVSTVDPFNVGLAGQVDNLVDEAGSGFQNSRFNNSVIYTTPDLSGFKVSLAGALGEQQGNWRSGRAGGGSVVYAAGPIYVAAGYHNLQGVNGSLGRRNANVGGIYDFGVLKLHALYEQTKASGLANLNFADVRSGMVGVSVPLGGGSLLASYVKHDDRTALQHDADQGGIGYTYPLSKRTSLYTAFAKIRNKNGATFTVGNATEVGTGDKAFNLGVTHNF